MLQLTEISKAFVTQTVLDEVDLHVDGNSRIGLIGRNGCGKSTLLRMIMGQVEPDSGTIYRAPGLRVSYLNQEPQITIGNTLEQEVKSVFLHINDLFAEEAKLLAQIEALTDEAQLKALNRLTTVHEEMARHDAYGLDAKVTKMLTGLGFSLDDLTRNIELFSGGWQMRVSLAKILLEGADIVLLDEPTNHLDMEACEWLEDFLKSYTGGVVVVSHDRRFLDNVVTEIAEVELGHLTLWTGNYTSFLVQKEELIELQINAAERQQRDLAKQTAFVERFRASATKSTQAKSREKQLSKIKRLEPPKTDTRRMSVRFPLPESSGRDVMTVRGLSKGYEGNQLFENLDADFKRQQRIFLLGANGCGKTTLFRIILGLETPNAGKIETGYNVKFGYFSQYQLETLEPELNCFETLHNVRPEMTQTEIRTLLGGLLFTGDQVFKQVASLSGGEKSKLAFAKLMLAGPNVLLLDEPTNHIDIPAKEVLEEALQVYEGSMLCISHDRYFIQQLATDIWEIYEGHLIQYPGNYDYYLDKRDEMRTKRTAAKKPVSAIKASSPEGKSNTSSSQNERRDLEKKLSQLEKSIIKLEQEIALLQATLDGPTLQSDYDRLHQVSSDIGMLQQKLAEQNDSWAALAHQLSEMS